MRTLAIVLVLLLSGCSKGYFGRSYVELRDPSDPSRVIIRAVSSDNSCTLLSYDPETQEVWAMSAAQGMSVNAAEGVLGLGSIVGSIFGGSRPGSQGELVKVENCVEALKAIYVQDSSGSVEPVRLRLEVEEPAG